MELFHETSMHKKTTNGFFLVEVLVATAVIGTVLVVLIGAVSNSVAISRLALERTQASYLLEEGAEAMKSIRDNAWTSITGLTMGTTYYLSWSGSIWTTTTTASKIGNFTRTVVCQNVSRDSNNDIVTSGGTNDTGTKKCTITVTWPSYNGTITETLAEYITDSN